MQEQKLPIDQFRDEMTMRPLSTSPDSDGIFHFHILRDILARLRGTSMSRKRSLWSPVKSLCLQRHWRLNLRVVTILVSLAVAGCANLTTISRSTRLPEQGRAIHLDAQQRLVYSNKNGSICAEPSPDAIQSVAASLGAGVSAPKEGAASISQALQQSTASTGLRTQSITLMRDALYRICEAAYNGKLTDRDVVQLLQRSQDVTMGVLAIEQLTGAVVAKQIVLGGSANATSSANVSNTKAQLDDAKRIEDQKKTAADTAQKQLDDDNTKLTADQAIAPKTDPIGKEMDDLNTNKIPKDKATLKSAQDEYQRAQRATLAIESNFNAALTAASATATGSGQFSDGGGALKNIDKDTADKLAMAVTTIVATVINKGHLTDTCINFLATYSLASPTTAGAQTLELCKQIIAADLSQDPKSMHPFFNSL